MNHVTGETIPAFTNLFGRSLDRGEVQLLSQTTRWQHRRINIARHTIPSHGVARGSNVHRLRPDNERLDAGVHHFNADRNLQVWDGSGIVRSSQLHRADRVLAPGWPLRLVACRHRSDRQMVVFVIFVIFVGVL